MHSGGQSPCNYDGNRLAKIEGGDGSVPAASFGSTLDADECLAEGMLGNDVEAPANRDNSCDSPCF